MIGILDINLGNLRSVSNAIDTIGFDSVIIKDKQNFDNVTHLIIPGVGNYNNAVQEIGLLGFRDCIKNFSISGRPILGICLGMQVLSTFGEEGGNSIGLGLIEGTVSKMMGSKENPLPHVGWNTVTLIRDHPVFNKVKNEVDFYFVHSYNFNCNSSEDIYGVTQYEQRINAIVAKNNVIGFQFHPEKSQGNGLKLLSNFCRWDGRC